MKSLLPILRYIPFGFRMFGIPGKSKTADVYPHKTLYPESEIVRSIPITLKKYIHWKFTRDLEEAHRNTAPRALVAVLDRGVACHIGANLDENKNLVAEVSKQFDLRLGEAHKVYQKPYLFPQVSYFEEAVASIAFDGQSNYYHWIFDALPQIHLLEKAELRVDKIYIQCSTPFQKATLNCLGYSLDRVISSDDYPYISTTRLIVPSFPGKSGYIPHWTCKFLRERLLPCGAASISASIGGSGDRIYLSREHASRRKIKNEAEVISVLSEYQFLTIYLEEWSFTEQVTIFNHARAVFSPHGAGLSNLVFSQPGTKVLEVFSPAYVNSCFWTLCSQVGLEYYYFLGEGTETTANAQPDKVGDNIIVNIHKLRQLLDLAFSNGDG